VILTTATGHEQQRPHHRTNKQIWFAFRQRHQPAMKRGQLARSAFSAGCTSAACIRSSSAVVNGHADTCMMPTHTAACFVAPHSQQSQVRGRSAAVCPKRARLRQVAHRDAICASLEQSTDCGGSAARAQVCGGAAPQAARCLTNRLLAEEEGAYALTARPNPLPLY
jgi:hypothetical protein